MRGQLQKNYVQIKNNPLPVFYKSYITSLVKIKILQTIQNIETNNETSNKMKKKKYINVRTIPKSATIVLEWDKIAPSARLLSWLGTDISINSSGVKQIWNHSNFLKAKETCVFIKQMNCFLRFVSFSSIVFFDRQYIYIFLYHVHMWYTYLYIVINWP